MHTDLHFFVPKMGCFVTFSTILFTAPSVLRSRDGLEFVGGSYVFIFARSAPGVIPVLLAYSVISTGCPPHPNPKPTTNPAPQVKLGKHRKTGQKVALKIIPLESLKSSKALKRVQLEVRGVWGCGGGCNGSMGAASHAGHSPGEQRNGEGLTALHSGKGKKKRYCFEGFLNF